MITFSDIVSALEANQLDLASDLIHREWNRLGAATTVYGIIRSGQVPVLALLRTQKLCTERDVVVFCSNAFHELQIKQVCIAYDMYLYLMRMFAAYGLRYFCGNLNVKLADSVTRSWTASIDMVAKWTDELRSRKRWADYLDFDNDVEFRLRMIHSELFFIKDCKALKEVPLKEVIFCLAAFLKSANDCPGDFLYRTIINQRNLVQFLMAVVGELKKITMNEKCVIRRRHVVRKLIKAYRKLKQIRSVAKLVQNVPAKLDEFTERDYDRSRAPTTVAAMKRFIQVFGEAIKNTSDSPNFPTKLNKMLPVLFHDSLWLNSKYRDLSSHGYPLSSLHVQEFHEMYYYRHLKQYMMLIAISSLVFTVYIFLDCTQNLFGLMRRTTSIEDQQALVRYAGNNKLHANQKALFRNIFRFLEYCMYLLETADGSSEQFVQESKESYIQKQILIEDLNAVHLEVERQMKMIEIVTFANSSIQSIHALVDSGLQMFRSKECFRRIIAQWRTGETISSDYYSRTAISMQRYIHQSIELDHTYSDQWRYREETDKIIAQFSTESTEFEAISDKLRSELHDNLANGYYQNIFGLDHKAQAITKTLKAHFTGTKDSANFKARNRQFKSILDRIRRDDEILLSNEFRRIVQSIRNIFIENDCSSFERFCVNFSKIPLKHRLALEYWQMQAMEILIKTKYFGDNFSTLKRSLPMIWGKTYRNYLAHDSWSYDLLTISNVSRTFVNGYVLAFDSEGVNIFSKACNFDLREFARIEERGFEWIKIQADLLGAYRQRDDVYVNSCLQANADTWGRFYCAPGKFLKIKLYSIPEVLSHDTPDMGNINPVAVELSLSYPNYSHIIYQAEVNTNLLLNLEQFDYIDIAEAIEQFKNLQSELITPCLGAALKYLTERGNFSTIQTLLEDYVDFSHLVLNFAVGYSMDGEKSHNPVIEMKNTQLDAFFQTQTPLLQDLLFIVRSNNVEAMRIALRHYQGSLTDAMLDDVMKACCMSGRLEMVKILLSNGVPMESIQPTTAMYHRRWNIVEYLLSNGTDPWQDEGLLVYVMVIEKNFRLVRHIIKQAFPAEFRHNIARCIAKDGSLPLFEYVLNRIDMWQCVGLLDCALKNYNPQVVDFLLEKVFTPLDGSTENPVLRSWLKVLNELRIVEFLKLDPFSLYTAMEHNLEAAEWMIEKAAKLSGVNMPVSILLNDQSRGHPSQSLESVKLCSTMIHDILSLSNEHKTREMQLSSTYVDQGTTLVASIDVVMHSIKPIANLCLDSNEFTIANSNSLMLSITELIHNLLKPHADCSPVVSETVSVLDGNNLQNHLRFLSTTSACYVIDEANPRDVDLSALVNAEDFSALHILPPTASTTFLANLLNLGADPLLTGNAKRTAFHAILLETHPFENLKLIYQHCIETNRTQSPDGVHVFNQPDIDGFTPLCYAARSRNFEAVEYMLQNGADPSSANYEGEAAILYDAILNRSVRMILLLLNHSPQLVNKPVTTDKDESVLEKAIEVNNSRLAQLLLDHGASISHRNHEGMTAVGIAIQKQSLECLQVLLKFTDGAGELITDSVTGDGKSALDYAQQLADPDTVQLITEHFENNKS